MSAVDLVQALGRPERVFDVASALRALKHDRVLVTGAAGMVGSRLVELLRDADIPVLASDLAPRSGVEMCVKLDITRFSEVLETVGFYRPSLIVNAAAQKDAVLGEANPWQTINTSVNGVQNLLNVGIRLVHLSTCKAANPEVAYGLGKAAAEKLVLAAGGTVVRFYNIADAGPNVYDTWRAAEDALPVTPCSRHMISLREAVGGLIVAATLPAGRYAVDPGAPAAMSEYARRVFGDRPQVLVPPRRGDRINEPLHASCERVEASGIDGLHRIVSQHDV